MAEKSPKSHKNQIRLKNSSILNVPFHKYEQDFTFIVNEQIYKTNRMIADLISKKISKFHSLDPTLNTITINTNTKGDFSKIINLINFEYEEFSTNDILFFNELSSIIDFDSYEIDLQDNNDEERTISNIFDQIKIHEKIEFFSKELTEDIDFLSANFYEFEDDILHKIKEMNDSTIENIVKNPNLRLRSENQLLHLINELYSFNSKYLNLYEFVYFNNCNNEFIKEFINVFDLNDINIAIWKKIILRLSNEIYDNEKRYKNKEIEKRFKNNEKYIEIPFKNNINEFDGIINFIRKNNNNLKDLINLTASSTYSGSIESIIEYENKSNYFYTNSVSNSWICIEFRKNKIIPTHYTIRTRSNNRFPKTWLIECSNNGNNWEIIDQFERILRFSYVSYWI